MPILGGIVALALAGAADAGVSPSALFSQPWDGAYNLFASQNDTGGGNGAYATVYDNFLLSKGSKISQIDFTGGYFNGTQAPIAGFTVTIYGDSAGAPGSSVYSEFVAGTAGEAATGVDQVFSYSLAADYAAAGHTKYWLSIVPDIAFPPQWGWGTSTGGDGAEIQNFFGSPSTLSTDAAFTLSGSGAPEPAAWALMLVGLGGLGAALRSRRRTVSAAV